MAIIIFYSGELVWQNKQKKFDEIISSTPISKVTLFISHYLIISVIPILMIGITVLEAFYFQISNNYLSNYISFFSLFYFGGMEIFLYSFFFISFQHLVNNKYLGILLVSIIVLVFGPLSTSLGIDYPLFKILSMPNMSRSFSEFTGFGQYAKEHHYFSIYWLSFIILFSILTQWFLKRVELLKSFVILTLGIFILIGVKIILNINKSEKSRPELLDIREAYERKFKQYESLAIPQVINKKMKIDFYPEILAYEINGEYIIENQSLDTMHHIFVSQRADYDSLWIENTTLIFKNKLHKGYLFQLKKGLLPSEELKVRFSLNYKVNGFSISKEIRKNGSYLQHSKFEPIFGYLEQFEISDMKERKRRDLPKKLPEASFHDHHKKESKFNFSKIDFEAIVSTSKNQKATSSGQLLSQWEKDDRNYYHFKSKDKIDGNIGYFSAKYTTRKTKYNDVNIEISHHPMHHHNIDEIFRISKLTLDYCAKSFGAYPHDHLRFAQTPSGLGFGGRAMSGMIAMSSSIFTKDIRSNLTINYTGKVIIHEIAHQWWGLQLEAKRLPGKRVISESIAKYVENILIEKIYGTEMAFKLNRYTMSRYFAGRSHASKPEVPLYVAENEQYIIYSKGYVVMLSLRDLIGEKNINLALSRFYKKYKNNNEATSIELINEFYQVSPRKYHVLIDDWFKRIISYDLKINDSELKKIASNKYKVSLNLETKRFQHDKKTKRININEPIIIEVYDINGDVLYSKKHLINKEEY